MYAHVQDGQIVALGNYPDLEWDEDEQRWWDLRDIGVRTARGWLEVQMTDRPDDTDTHTYELSYELVDGHPVQTWTAREWTTEEIDARATAALRDANDQALRDGLAAAIDAALLRQAAYQAVIDTPNSEIKANPQQHIISIARQGKRSERALIRLARLVGGLTDSSDTGTD